MALFQPEITVVIPTYNREKTIKYCLDSVLNQTFSPLEIIVVDDCSTDNTVEIVKNYPDSRIRCIVLESNSGAQVARNRGIKESRGKWIAFQDSDDEWVPSKLEKQVNVLKHFNYDPMIVVHTDAIWLKTSSGEQLQVQLPIVEGENVYPTLLNAPGPLFPTILTSHQALEKINFLDEGVPSYQEWDTVIRLAKHCHFIFLPEPLFVYHLHEGETISKNKKREIIGYQYILDKFEDEIKRVCGQETWQNHLMLQANKCLEFELWNEADRYLKQLNRNYSKIYFLKTARILHIKPSILRGKLQGYHGRISKILNQLRR